MQRYRQTLGDGVSMTRREAQQDLVKDEKRRGVSVKARKMLEEQLTHIRLCRDYIFLTGWRWDAGYLDPHTSVFSVILRGLIVLIPLFSL